MTVTIIEVVISMEIILIADTIVDLKDAECTIIYIKLYRNHIFDLLSLLSLFSLFFKQINKSALYSLYYLIKLLNLLSLLSLLTDLIIKPTFQDITKNT